MKKKYLKYVLLFMIIFISGCEKKVTLLGTYCLDGKPISDGNTLCYEFTKEGNKENKVYYRGTIVDKYTMDTTYTFEMIKNDKGTYDFKITDEKGTYTEEYDSKEDKIIDDLGTYIKIK